MERHKEGILLALVSVLIWSTVATAFKLSLRHLASAHLLLYSAAVSTLVLGAILVIQGKIGALRATTFPEFRLSLVLGGLNPSTTPGRSPSPSSPPFLSLLFIHLLVGKEIYPSTYAGLGLIGAGLLLRSWRRQG